MALVRPSAADPLKVGALPPGYELRAEQSSAFAVIGEGLYPLVRLSPEGAWLWTGDELEGLREGEAITVALEVDGVETHSIRAQVQRRPSMSRQEPLQLRFVQLSTRTARQIAALLEGLREQGIADPPRVQGSVRERVEDPARIAALCGLLALNRSRALLRAEGARPMRLTARGFDAAAGAITWEARQRLPEPPFRIEWVGYSNQYAFTVEELEWRDGLLITPAPERLVRCRRRSVARARVPEGMEIRFRHSLWPDVVVQRSVRDVSVRGIGFWGDPVQDLVYPGLRLEAVEVIAPGAAPVRLCAEVRLVAPEESADARGQGRAVGMRVTPASEADGVVWMRMVGEMLHPTTRSGMDRAGDVWNVLEGSGSLHLSGRDPRSFQPLRESYLKMAARLRNRPEIASQAVVVDEEDRVEGTLSMIKAFDHTWIAHHGARRPGAPAGGSSRRAVREVWLRALEEAAADPQARVLGCFVEGKVRWLKGALVDFARSRERTGQACAVDFTLFEGGQELAKQPLPEGMEVTAPNPGEWRTALQSFGRALPRLYVEAFDLLPARFELNRIRPAWQEAGLRRVRAMRVARRSGRVLAAAVLDDAEPGVSLFGLLSGVRLISVGPDVDASAREQAFTALLRDAAQWYADRGTDQFVYYALGEGEMRHALDAGYRPLGPGWIWLQSTALMAEWTEHLYEMTSPRAPDPD
ncbi:MAG TPA: hypothetical protein VIG99_17335 [Myxococcaceae bacterium]